MPCRDDEPTSSTPSAVHFATAPLPAAVSLRRYQGPRSLTSFPPAAPQPDSPLPSTGSAGTPSPASSVPLRSSDFSSPVPRHFVAFARRYHRGALRSSLAPGTNACSDAPGLGLRDAIRSIRWRRRDLPGSWGTLTYMPRSLTPAGPGRLARQRTGVAFRLLNGVCSRIVVLSRLSHAACTLPVYASQPGSPPHHATLGSDRLPALSDRTCTCWVPTIGFCHDLL